VNLSIGGGRIIWYDLAATNRYHEYIVREGKWWHNIKAGTTRK